MNKKKVGVTGARGFIGQALMKSPNMVSIDGDITDAKSLKMEIESKKPDLIVHLAAITDIEKCEKPENEKLVKAVNVSATFDVANICDELGIGMVFISSFQVFNGKKMFNRAYTEKDLPAPVNFYGLSKLTAEAYQAVYSGMKIIRAPYVFDRSKLNKHIVDLDSVPNVQYPDFLRRSFMHRSHFLISLLHYIENFESMPPILNISTTPPASWYRFMDTVSTMMNLMNPPSVKKDDDGTYTKRPYNGGLSPALSYSLGFPRYTYFDGITQMFSEGG